MSIDPGSKNTTWKHPKKPNILEIILTIGKGSTECRQQSNSCPLIHATDLSPEGWLIPAAHWLLSSFTKGWSEPWLFSILECHMVIVCTNLKTYLSVHSPLLPFLCPFSIAIATLSQTPGTLSSLEVPKKTLHVKLITVKRFKHQNRYSESPVIFVFSFCRCQILWKTVSLAL